MTLGLRAMAEVRTSLVEQLDSGKDAHAVFDHGDAHLLEGGLVDVQDDRAAKVVSANVAAC